MSSNSVKVRAVRPHDTYYGMRQPGDEYDRPKAEADTLVAKGVVEIAAAKGSRKRK